MWWIQRRNGSHDPNNRATTFHGVPFFRISFLSLFSSPPLSLSTGLSWSRPPQIDKHRATRIICRPAGEPCLSKLKSDIILIYYTIGVGELMTSFPLNNVSLTDQQHSVPHGDRHLDRHHNFPFLDVFPRLPQLSPLANYLVLAVLLVGWDQGTLHCSPPVRLSPKISSVYGVHMPSVGSTGLRFSLTISNLF